MIASYQWAEVIDRDKPMAAPAELLRELGGAENGPI